MYINKYHPGVTVLYKLHKTLNATGANDMENCQRCFILHIWSAFSVTVRQTDRVWHTTACANLSHWGVWRKQTVKLQNVIKYNNIWDRRVSSHRQHTHKTFYSLLNNTHVSPHTCHLFQNHQLPLRPVLQDDLPFLSGQFHTPAYGVHLTQSSRVLPDKANTS